MKNKILEILKKHSTRLPDNKYNRKFIDENDFALVTEEILKFFESRVADKLERDRLHLNYRGTEKYKEDQRRADERANPLCKTQCPQCQSIYLWPKGKDLLSCDDHIEAVNNMRPKGKTIKVPTGFGSETIINAKTLEPVEKK